MKSGIPSLLPVDDASSRAPSAEDISTDIHPLIERTDAPDTSSLSGSRRKHNVTSPTPAQSSSSVNSPQHPAATSRTPSFNADGETSSSRASQEPSSSKKSRVQLAADQPLTTHGKPRERVYVACSQCRNRKVRCDGGKPECFNCSHRTDANLEPCSYDPTPRRRGKDRTAGSRKLAPYISKKTRTTRSRLEEEAKRNKPPQPGPSQEPGLARQSGPGITRDSTPLQIVPSFLVEGSSAVLVDSHLPQPSSGSVRSAPPLIPGPVPVPSVELQVQQQGRRSARIVRVPLPSHVVPSHNESVSDTVLLQLPQYGLASHRYAAVDDDDYAQDDDVVYIATEPSVQFTRETWWDALLAVYAVPPDRPDLMPTLTVDVRNKTSERIAADLRFLFQASLHWLSFINIPRFFSSLFNPVTRQTIQPSLILAALGLATFLQSSELELGAKGREKALRLIDQARASFDASVNSGWIDVGLVQAAWLLAFFEIQAHPKLSGNRTLGSMATLDALVRCLSLTTLDVDDPRATVFTPRVVPIVVSDTPPITPPVPMLDLWASGVDPHADALHTLGSTGTDVPPGTWRCGCEKYSLGYHWPLVRDLAPQWSEMPMWPKNMSPGELLKEECRRLAWSSVMLAATHTTKSTAGTDWETQHLWIKDPSNFALLFPGENVAPPGASVASSKDSVWALYMRTLLLWHSSLRMRCDLNFTDADRAQYAMSAWLEIDTIESMLDRHTCMATTGFMVQMRDTLFK
ncbi:hypothetical protein TRAPUB_6230 [Trametes pubescens]|uniref:Zn(2)-C6 fungal-type domain-containing protein n=1 Tax=Trametes pubescens TaxID=154538 RepID=A0A1M2V6H4_TRAPU|nr:hypothetical protein TRAPUB_6230 [Trametes pubescens]